MSQTGKISRRKNISKIVNEFLYSTKPDEILTPNEFRNLANSMRREVVEGF